MGWTYTNKDKHVSAGEYIEKHLLVWNRPGYKYTVLDGGVVKFRTYYGAVEKLNLETNERTVFAVVILLNYAKDYHNFGYKDMDETCGPCQSECPERILKLLTPTDHEYAKEWRQRCWDNINNKKNKPKIQTDMKLMYGGKTYTVLRSLGRRGFMVESEGREYRMKSTQAKQATVIA